LAEGKKINYFDDKLDCETFLEVTDMLIDPEETLLLCSSPDAYKALMTICSAAMGDPVDCFDLAEYITVIRKKTAIAPGILKKPEAKPSVSTEDNEKNCSGGGSD
jgi:hypothetical protein